VGLVFVAAFAPDDGEVLGQVAATSKDSILNAALVQRTFPTWDGGTSPELLVDPPKFPETFAADLPTEQAAVLAATQRPIAGAAFSDPCGPPAWKGRPSWAVVATGDKAAGADLVRSMAERAGAEIVEVDASHLAMISQPRAVADVIARAAEAVASGR
jgi:pimeloyl-ACP methyl ester carboxylesterase